MRELIAEMPNAHVRGGDAMTRAALQINDRQVRVVTPVGEVLKVGRLPEPPTIGQAGWTSSRSESGHKCGGGASGTAWSWFRSTATQVNSRPAVVPVERRVAAVPS
jgi:hypothetical protein